MVIIIILMASQRSHPTFSGKVGFIKEAPGADAISLLSAPSFFFNRSKMPFVTDILHLTLLSKIVMGKMNGF